MGWGVLAEMGLGLYRSELFDKGGKGIEGEGVAEGRRGEIREGDGKEKVLGELRDFEKMG